MKHNCLKWIEDGKCSKCGRPEWSIGEEYPWEVGDIVSPKSGYTFCGRKFVIESRLKDGSYRLAFLGGRERGNSIERYEWWELKWWVE